MPARAGRASSADARGLKDGKGRGMLHRRGASTSIYGRLSVVDLSSTSSLSDLFMVLEQESRGGGRERWLGSLAEVRKPGRQLFPA
jgi:hypothetical protein